MVAGGESEKQYLDNTQNILYNDGIDNGEDEDDDGEDDPISDQKVRTLLMRSFDNDEDDEDPISDQKVRTLLMRSIDNDDGEDGPISDQKVRTPLMRRRGTVTTLITRQPFDRPAVSTH